MSAAEPSRLPEGGAADEIRAHLEVVLASRGFASSSKLSRFLRFIVERTLAGEHETIKEYLIAVEVYGKGPDYDPQVDSAVRVEASRLRSKLRDYYRTEGRLDSIRISLPRGRYVPTFERIASTPPPPAQSSPTPAAPQADSRARPVRRTKMLIAWSAAGVLLPLLLIAASYQFSRRTPPPASPFRVVPLTSYQGREEAAAFSPDGRQVAFVWNQAGSQNSEIYVKRLDTTAPLRLTHNPAVDGSPAWSPRGDRIAFLRSLGANRSMIMLVPPLGGPERKLTEVRAAAISGLSWSPDGRFLAASDRRSPTSLPKIVLVSAKTGEKTPLTSSQTRLTAAFNPAFSPDGRSVAFDGEVGSSLGETYLARIADGRLRRLTKLGVESEGVAWLPDGEELIIGRFLSTTERGLWRIPSSGGAPVPLVVGDYPSQPAVSPDGSLLVFTKRVSEFDIFRYPVEGSEGPPDLFVSSTRFDGNPQYSPDGTRVAFSSSRSGQIEIWAAAADGSRPFQLTFIGFAGSPRWSPDGSQIAFDSTVDGDGEIYVIDAEGGTPRRLTDNPAQDIVPSWSPDGSWIYFASDRGGRLDIWKRPADPNDPAAAVQVTREGGMYPAASADGRLVYYAKDSAFETSLWRVPANGGREEPVIEKLPSGWANWTLAKHGVYFVDVRSAETSESGEATWQVRFLDFRSGAITDLVALATASDKNMPTRGGPGLGVSPDGKWILSGQVAIASDLMLVEDFQ